MRIGLPPLRFSSSIRSQPSPFVAPERRQDQDALLATKREKATVIGPSWLLFKQSNDITYCR
jgi:hypothetical protein